MSDRTSKHKKAKSTQAEDARPHVASEVGSARDASGPTTDGSETPELATPQVVAALKQEVDELNNRYLRAEAELENYRKRSQRDMEEERRYAGLPLMRDLLSVLDNMQRALEAAKQAEGSAGMLEGVKMVADQLLEALQQHGCKRIEALGTAFDPNLHEAVGQEPSNQQPAQNVTRELRVGYQLHDRVIRPSQVFVSQGPLKTKAVDDS